MRQTRTKLVLPSRLPIWTGGVNYLETVSLALRELEAKGQLEVVRPPKRFLTSRSRNRSLKYFAASALDLVNSFRGTNFPWPLTRLARQSFQWTPDLQDVELPGFFSSEQLDSRSATRAQGVERNRMFFFSSYHSLAVFQGLGLDKARIGGVVRFTPMARLSSKAAHKQTCGACREHGFFYLPNQWWRHKNHLLALDAFTKYRALGGQRHLVLTGNMHDDRWPDYEMELRNLLKDRSDIHALGLVDRDRQLFLLETAVCLLQPSLYEGWSTSIEEALHLGTPIIASDLVVLREQLDGQADVALFPGHDPMALTEALMHPPTRLSEDVIADRRLLRQTRFISDLSELIGQISASPRRQLNDRSNR